MPRSRVATAKNGGYGARATSSNWISRSHRICSRPARESKPTRGSVAIGRGPFVYCFEGIDNPDVDDLRDVTLADDTTFDPVDESTLGGITKLQCAATVTEPTGLYRPVTAGEPPTGPVTATAIPCYAWANRGPSPMTIWVNRASPPPRS